MPPKKTTPAPNDPLESGNREDYLDTLAKGLSAMRLFGSEMQALSIQETADLLQLSRSAARRILLTLERLGYMAQEGRKYRLTAQVLDFGFAYIASRSLPEIARSAQLDESVALATLEGGDAVFIERIQPHQTFRIDFDVGNRLPAYCFSVGQVLLAGLDDEAFEDYLRTTELKAITPLTVTDPKVLRKTIARIRKDGYRMGISDMIFGVGGIAVPIRNRRNEVVAAMVVPMFHGRDQAEMEQRYLPLMQQAAERISGFLVRGRDG
jgi:IclR family pca regulon transcriptional regulator